jgi:hypothetical protein
MILGIQYVPGQTLRGAADPTTTERIGKMIGELEHEKQLDRER